ncbi:hypothetical protein ACIRPK_12315 [Kitasatospora sp. NPDC101801]|uniref:hypothetical protein n=1 Tax=Kitasatospora sp. NPDC101801 TaxID=3364103 RepID=UPI00382EE950
MTEGQQQAQSEEPGPAGPPQPDRPLPPAEPGAAHQGNPPNRASAAVPVFPGQGQSGWPGIAATPPPRQGGYAPGEFPPPGYGGQPVQGRYGPSTFRSPDIDEPDWSALAQQNAEASRLGRRRLMVTLSSVGAALVIGAIVALSVYVTNGQPRVPAEAVQTAPAPSASAVAPPSASASKSATPPSKKPEEILSKGSSDKAPLTAEVLFPNDTVTVQGRTYTRNAVDFSGSCGDYTANGLGPILRDQMCRGLYRATYTADKVTVTLGVAVFDNKVQADKADSVYKGNVQPLIKGGAPKFCADLKSCAVVHDSFGRYLYFTVTGTKDGSAPAATDPTGKDVTNALKAVLVARGTEAAKKTG